MDEPLRYRMVHKNGAPVTEADLGGVSFNALTAALADRVRFVDGELAAPDGTPIDVAPDAVTPEALDRALADRVRLVDGVLQAPDGTPIPTSDVVAAPVSYLQGMKPVGSRTTTQVQQLSNGTDTSMTTRIAHVAMASTAAVRIIYASWGGYGTTAPTTTIAVRAALERTDGTVLPVFFDGRRETLLDAPGVRISDPVPIQLVKGAAFWSRSWVSVAAGQKWINNTTYGAPSNGPLAGGVVGNTDATMSAASVFGAGYGNGFGPVAILADGPNIGPVIVGVGDSIVAGEGDGGVRSNQDGFFSIALAAAGLSHLKVAISGESAGQFLTGTPYRHALVSAAQVAVVNYGINATITGQPLAALQVTTRDMWLRIRADGPRAVFACTLTPRTASTNGWTSTAAQTPATGEGVRVGYNDWLRDGAPEINGVAVAAGTGEAMRAGDPGHPLTGYFETADRVESARNSGRWKTSPVFTADGVHPSPAGHEAMAAAIDPARLVAAAHG